VAGLSGSRGGASGSRCSRCSPAPGGCLHAQSTREGDREGRSTGWIAASLVSALVTSVKDLHVRIALQEADSEKRRLISRTPRAILGR